MIVGVDIDGVLADLISKSLLMNPLNKGYTKKDVIEWDFFHLKIGLTSKQQHDLFLSAWQDWKNMPLEYFDAARMLKRLAKKHRVSLITHRDFASHSYVVQWLGYRELEYSDLYLVDNGLDKLAFPIDCLIDDSPKEIEKASLYPQKTLFVITQPWNKSIELTKLNTIRTKNLGDAIDKILLSKEDK